MVGSHHPSRRTALAFLGASVAVPSALAAEMVDLALVLAIDCSYSIDAEEYQQQMRGTGQAFLDSKILEAISRGPYKKIAVSAFLWSDADRQYVIVPWRLLAKPADAIEIADIFLRAPRDIYRGSTGTGAALKFAEGMLQSAPPSLRQVVDISTDGTRNTGPEVEPVRDQLVRNGITINGLAIANEVHDLPDYVLKHVIGGNGHFMIVAKDYNAYTEAIKTKLLKEITNTDLT
jgi:Protein of unknown function (DUF1194)